MDGKPSPQIIPIDEPAHAVKEKDLPKRVFRLAFSTELATAVEKMASRHLRTAHQMVEHSLMYSVWKDSQGLGPEPELRRSPGGYSSWNKPIEQKDAIVFVLGLKASEVEALKTFYERCEGVSNEIWDAMKVLCSVRAALDHSDADESDFETPSGGKFCSLQSAIETNVQLLFNHLYDVFNGLDEAHTHLPKQIRDVLSPLPSKG